MATNGCSRPWAALRALFYLNGRYRCIGAVEPTISPSHSEWLLFIFEGSRRTAASDFCHRRLRARSRNRQCISHQAASWMDRPLAVQESSGPSQSLAAIRLRALDWRASGGKEPARTSTASQQLCPQHATGKNQSRNPETHGCCNWNNLLATRWGVSAGPGVNSPPRNANRIAATS